jgi:uncharacterized protein YjbI with pentapeptide repeats
MGCEVKDKTVRGDFRNSLAQKSKFENCRFVESPFGISNLLGAVFIECVFEKCDLAKSNLAATTIKGCTFVECNLDQVDFSSAWITDTNFIGGRAEYSKFKNATLRNVKFETQLHGADLRYASAEDVDYGSSNLWGCEIRVNCNAFNGQSYSDRSLKIMLALLAMAKGNETLSTEMAVLAGPEALEMVKRLTLKEGTLDPQR